MMDLGSGIAVAGLCVSGGAVAITAIRTFAKQAINGINGLDGKNGKNGADNCRPCPDHSGIVACLEAIEKSQDRHEIWMTDISKDIKRLLERQ